MQNTPNRDRKRDRSSEGETPKPENKLNKMASEQKSTTSSQSSIDTVSKQLQTLITSVDEIKKNQDGLKKTLESKIDKLKTDLMTNIETKVKALHDDLSLDIAREGSRIDELVSSVRSIQGRLTTVENVCSGSGLGDGPLWDSSTDNGNDRMDYSGWNVSGRRIDPLNDPDLTVIGSYIPFTEGEDLVKKVGDLIMALGEDVSRSVTITGVKRFAPKYRNKPGLVKISFQSLDQKILVLRNKMKLRDITEYKRVFLKSCKTHTERLIELNARAILKELPRGKSFRVDANGRIKTHSAATEAAPGNNGNQQDD